MPTTLQNDIQVMLATSDKMHSRIDELTKIADDRMRSAETWASEFKGDIAFGEEVGYYARRLRLRVADLEAVIEIAMAYNRQLHRRIVDLKRGGDTAIRHAFMLADGYVIDDLPLKFWAIERASTCRIVARTAFAVTRYGLLVTVERWAGLYHRHATVLFENAFSTLRAAEEAIHVS